MLRASACLLALVLLLPFGTAAPTTYDAQYVNSALVPVGPRYGTPADLPATLGWIYADAEPSATEVRVELDDVTGRVVEGRLEIASCDHFESEWGTVSVCGISMTAFCGSTTQPLDTAHDEVRVTVFLPTASEECEAAPTVGTLHLRIT